MRGYDGGKKVNGRKRHILVDSMGHLLAVCVHSAGIHDREGPSLLLTPAFLKQSPLLKKIYTDKGYRGKGIQYIESRGLEGEVVRHHRDKESYVLKKGELPPALKGFHVLPKRWIVERTFAWFSLCRRLSKDYELHMETTEAWLWLRSAVLTARRLSYQAN